MTYEPEVVSRTLARRIAALEHLARTHGAATMRDLLALVAELRLSVADTLRKQTKDQFVDLAALTILFGKVEKLLAEQERVLAATECRCAETERVEQVPSAAEIEAARLQVQEGEDATKPRHVCVVLPFARPVKRAFASGRLVPRSQQPKTSDEWSTGEPRK